MAQKRTVKTPQVTTEVFTEGNKASDLKVGDLIENNEGFHLINKIQKINKNEMEFIRCWVFSLKEESRNQEKKMESFKFPVTMVLNDPRIPESVRFLKFYREGKQLK